VRELGVAALVGVLLGLGGDWLLARADELGTATSTGRKVAALALALAAYFVADGLESSGFIAAFLAGLAFGVGDHERAESAVAFTESLTVPLSIVVWLAFGLLVVDGDLLARIDLAVVAFALLSLTVVSMVPVAVALVGERFDRTTVGFMGWFGPRGLASIVFAVLALQTLEAEGLPTGPLLPVVVTTVTLSVVLHGFSARPLASWFGRRAAHLPGEAPELRGVHEPGRRFRGTAMHEHGLDG
jgi:NhaP-type Na+/H+ or K+/H+ antiporter